MQVSKSFNLKSFKALAISALTACSGSSSPAPVPAPSSNPPVVNAQNGQGITNPPASPPPAQVVSPPASNSGNGSKPAGQPGSGGNSGSSGSGSSGNSSGSGGTSSGSGSTGSGSTGSGSTTATGTASGTPAAPVKPIGISGWWVGQVGDSTSTSPDEPSTSAYSCKAFFLINEAQMKEADGWECWSNTNSNYFFHVEHLGTILSEANNQLSYQATGGCATADPNTTVTNIFQQSNNGSTLTIPTDANEIVNKIAASTWYLSIQQNNIPVGCVSESDDLTFTPRSDLQQALIGLSN